MDWLDDRHSVIAVTPKAFLFMVAMM